MRNAAGDYGSLDRGINTNAILMGVVIPRDFGKDLAAGRSATVQLLVDGSDSNTASIAMGYAESVVQGYSAAVRSQMLNRKGIRVPPPPVVAQMRVWYNSSLESKNFVVPGLIAVILMILTGQLTTLTIAREWEMGTMEQILSTPLRPAEMVLGKMLAYFLVGLVDAVLAFVSGVTVFAVPFRGSLLVLAVSTLVFLCGAMFWGIFISAGCQNAGGGIPDGHAEHVPAGIPAFRVRVLDRHHAEVDPGHQHHRALALLRHHSEGPVSQGRRAGHHLAADRLPAAVHGNRVSGGRCGN